jgi:hypothetical protein
MQSGNFPVAVITVNFWNAVMHLPSVNDGWVAGDGEA